MVQKFVSVAKVVIGIFSTRIKNQSQVTVEKERASLMWPKQYGLFYAKIVQSPDNEKILDN